MPTAGKIEGAPRPARLNAGTVVIAMLLAILAIALVERSDWARRHFTHVDDIGVAASILEARQEFDSIERLRAIIHNDRLRQYDSAKFKLLRRLDEAGILGPAFVMLAPARDMAAVPLRWTYAPLQYVATPFFVAQNAGYGANLSGGRGVSAAVSLIAIVVLAWTAWQLRIASAASLAIAAPLLAAGSAEFLLMSANMSNYAAGVLASAAACLAVIHLARCPLSGWRSAIGFGLLLVALVYLSYQVLPLLPPLFIALYLSRLIDERQQAASGASGHRTLARLMPADTPQLVIAGLVLAAAMVPTYLLFLSTVRPITWNAGAAGEYLAPQWAEAGGGLAYLAAALRFAATRFYTVFTTTLTPFQPGTVADTLFGIAAFVLFVAGLFLALVRPASRTERTFGLFAVLAVAGQIGSSLAGASALSPTRHALVYLPVYALPIALALGHIAASRAGMRPPARAILTAVLAAVLLAVFAGGTVSHHSMLAARTDPVSEQRLSRLAAETGADAIVEYDHTYNAELMAPDTLGLPVFNDENLNVPWIGGRLPSQPLRLLAISTRSALGEADARDLAGRVLASLPPGGQSNRCPQNAKLKVLVAEPGLQTYEVYPMPNSGLNGFFASSIELQPAPCPE